MKKRNTLLLVLLFPIALFSQEPAHVPGEALIRLEPKADVNRLASQLQLFNGQATEFKVLEEVAPYMRIWRVSFDHNNIPEKRFLNHLNRTPGIMVAQYNHTVELRSTVPDDPEFQNQWQYINEGLGNCVEGADIDADLAWGITTGGKNSFGDDIVVCIVDDGLDPNHQDFGDNIWVNEAEIPNNGIDDDNNGFVDDYAGWNTDTDTDDIDVFNGHGTPVAGIVGAKGNNGIGVAGVNWDVKLMIVFGGSGVESEVLKAYSFPLAHRMRYNETAGAEGSFVVATNSSWGVDFGQPADAPLWCAFYDTLGVHGILNAGATINSNENVDVVGDLPTACPSDFMISVTNLNCWGIRIASAGFGAETIDLGAPGQGTWTTAEGNTYGGFGGTSGATPHVAGAIALLYSAPCAQLTQLSIESPGEAALLVRQAILEGVKPNSSIEGLTVTGGTLNLYNSLQLLLDGCGPCPAAYALQSTVERDSSALVDWISTDATIRSDLYWREIGDTTWQMIEDTIGPAEISGLRPCTPYEFYVEDACVDTTVRSEIAIFRTEGCCDAPTNLIYEARVDTTVLSWQGVATANAYRVTVICPADTLTYDSVFANTLTITGLDSCQTCTATVQSLCRDDLPPDSLGTDILFDVLGCGSCLDFDYCLVEASSQFEYIDSISINGLENASGDDEGYGDYTGLSTSLETGVSYTVFIKPGWPDNVFVEDYRVFIDFNQDGVLDFDTELAGAIEFTEEAAIEVPIVIPDDAVLGSTRMRIAMSWEGGPIPICDNEIEGETEDYCVDITDEIPPCTAPSGLAVDSIGYQAAILTWAGSNQAYNLRIRPEGSVDWVTLQGVDQPAISLEGLELCTNYEVQIAGLCGELSSPWSDSFLFSTSCNPLCDGNMAMLTASAMTDTSAILSWQATEAALSYELQVRKNGSGAWDTYPTEDLSLELQGLDSCSLYDARISIFCEGINNVSQPSSIINFETGCLTSIQDLRSALEIEVAPNPFVETLSIQLKLERSQLVSFLLHNAAGQLLLEKQEVFAQGTQQSSLSTASLPQGLYWLTIQTEQGTATVKVVKQ